MTDPKVVHAVSTRILSAVMVVLGVAMVVQGVSSGRVLTIGLLLGTMFILAGAGRIYLQTRR